MDILSKIKPFKKIVLVWSRHHKIIGAVLSFLIIFLLIVLMNLWTDFLSNNEYDTVIVAKQFVQKDWIPHDWYLNQDFGYRNFFNLMFGIFTFLPVDLAYVALGFRIILFLGFALAFYRLMRTFNIPILIFLPLFYHYMRDTNLFAGETIIDSVEAKNFAYIFALLSLDSLLRKKYRTMMLFLGFSLSSHILVGFYATLCSGLTILFTPQSDKHHSFSIITWKENMLMLLRLSPFYLLSGVFGIYTLIHYATENSVLTAIEKQIAALIYVTFRVPQCNYIFFIRIPKEIIFYFLTFILGVAFFKTKQNLRARNICLYSLWTLLCVGIGITITFLKSDISLLKFYWYRYFDSISMIAKTFLIGYVLYKLYLYLHKKCQALSLTLGLKKINLALTLKVICLIILTSYTYYFVFRKAYNVFKPTTRKMVDKFKAKQVMPTSLEHFQAATWIKTNTKKNSLFLIEPHGKKNFYYYAERPRLMSIKHSAQSDVHILEWFQRMKDLSFNDDNNQMKIYKGLEHPIRAESAIHSKSTKYKVVKALNDARQKKGLNLLVRYHPPAYRIQKVATKNFNKLSSPYLKKLKAKYGKDYSAVYYIIDGKREKNFPFQLVYQNEKVSIYKL